MKSPFGSGLVRLTRYEKVVRRLRKLADHVSALFITARLSLFITSYSDLYWDHGAGVSPSINLASLFCVASERIH